MDVCAPFGGAEGMVKEFKEKGFPNRPVKTLRPRKDGQGLEMVEVRVADKKPEDEAATEVEVG